MKRKTSKLYSAILATGVVASFSVEARAQIATLDKGHALLINNGLQQWGFDSDTAYGLDYPTLQNANLTAVNWGFGGTDMSVLTSPGDKWGKWTDWHYNGTTITPQTALDAGENAHKADLITVQVGDEGNQSDMETGTQTRDWFLAAGNGTATTSDDVFPNSLLYVNSFFINSDAGYANFLSTANPDAISWDSYPFSNPAGQYITPQNWLSLGQRFRRHGLGSYIGATGAAPRPYGTYTQTYHDGYAVDPGEVQIRWQAFAAWTMGYTFTDAFIYAGGNNNFANSPGGPVYAAYKETARQSKNLGPALVRLISTGFGTSIVQGQDASGGATGVPGNGWQNFSPNDAPVNQRFLQSVSAVNLGTKNNGHPGDVYIGFFNPLQLSYGDAAGTAYFMVTNGLGGDLTLPNGSADNTATVAETRQQLTLNFDFGASGVNALERLSRDTGQLEVINTSFSDGGNTIWTSLGGSLYRLQLTLDGGTGDLFKYYDGSPFVGIDAPPSTMFWDADGASAGNNTGTGAGLGGGGTWDSSATKWYPGSGADSKWSSASNAVFYGSSGGTVTLASPQSASGLSFKSNGYRVTGSTLTMTGSSSISVDPGVSARIDSQLGGSFGINKSGNGTLILGNSANTYAGSTTVSAGVLSISSDGNLGAIPASTATSIFIGGGTLQLTASFTLNANRAIDMGASGGTIDVSAPLAPTVTFAPTNGFRGGDLIKTGNGTFFASATTGGINKDWTGNLILKAGTWRINATDGLPINPITGGPRPAQVTFDGGTLQLNASIGASQSNRGITINAGGGTIDTQAFTFTWPGAVSGSVATAVLNKIGSGILRLNTAPTASNYPGTLNVNGGTLQLNGGTAMGDLASINLANTAGVSFMLTGAGETIGSLSGGGASGGNANLNSFVLTAGGNGSSTTYAGVISSVGAGGLTKAGSGAMTLGNANTYIGATTVSAGKLIFAANHTSSSSLTIATNADAEIAQNGSRVIKTPTLSINGTGQLNLNDNKLITQSPIGSLSGSTYTGVTGLIASGRNSTNWNGPGIITTMSAAASSNYTSIGVARGAEVKAGTSSMTASWGGQTITGTDVLVMYTYGGDANLDGKINIDDYVRIDAGIASGLSGWSNGDFNYDGKVNVDDYAMVIDVNMATQGMQFPTAGGIGSDGESVVSVPEPAGAVLLSGFALLGARRRRRARRA